MRFVFSLENIQSLAQACWLFNHPLPPCRWFVHPEVVGGTSQAFTERGDGRSLSASPPPWRRRREETLSLSLSLPRPSDGRNQSLVTSSPPEGNALAQRLGTLATSLDLRSLCGLRIRAPYQQPRSVRSSFFEQEAAEVSLSSLQPLRPPVQMSFPWGG